MTPKAYELIIIYYAHWFSIFCLIDTGYCYFGVSERNNTLYVGTYVVPTYYEIYIMYKRIRHLLLRFQCRFIFNLRSVCLSESYILCTGGLIVNTNLVWFYRYLTYLLQPYYFRTLSFGKQNLLYY